MTVGAKIQSSGETPFKMGNSMGFFWPTNLSKLLQKGMYVPNINKVGKTLWSL